MGTKLCETNDTTMSAASSTMFLAMSELSSPNCMNAPGLRMDYMAKFGKETSLLRIQQSNAWRPCGDGASGRAALSPLILS